MHPDGVEVTCLCHTRGLGVVIARRHALRQEKTPPLLDLIRSHILAMSKAVLPKSAAGQACSYALSIWTRLIRFLDYPELELSTDLAENSMRSNWIQIGSEQAGPRIAAIWLPHSAARVITLQITAAVVRAFAARSWR